MRDPLDGFEWEMGWTWSDFGFRKIPVEGLDGVGTRIALEGCVLSGRVGPARSGVGHTLHKY